MNMSDPVMRRAMFRQGGPVSSKGYGITSNFAVPEQNAMAMQTMFQPQGFRDGGPVQYFQEGGEATAAAEEPASLSLIERFRGTPAERELAATRASAEAERPASPSLIERFRGTPAERELAATRASENPLPESNVRKVMGEVTSGIGGFLGSVGSRAGEILRGGSRSGSGASSSSAERRAVLEAQASDQMAERQAQRSAAEDQPTYREAPAPAAARREEQAPAERKAPVKDRLSIRLDELKAEREANKSQRKENQLLALMQAGFAIAAGRSPNAIQNIAAGGASGVATLADLEKTRRAEDTALRREALDLELAGEKMRDSRADRQAGRELTATQRQMSLLRDVSVNTRQEVSSISNTIAGEEAKLLAMGLTEEQKAPIKSEIQRLKNQRDAAVEQMYSVYDSMGIKRPKTPEQQQAGEFKFLGAKK